MATAGPSIGEVVAQEMRDKDLDVELLAELSNLDPARVEAARNDRGSSFAELRAMSRILGVDLELYDPDEDEAPERLPEVTTLLKANEYYLAPRLWPHVIEAAEVAREIVELERLLGYPDRFEALRDAFLPDGQFEDPLHEAGKRLARRVRSKLALGDEPIASMRELCARLHVVVVEVHLPAAISALCLADAEHGPTILLNVLGRGETPLPRRYTLAHELCHVLFDRHATEPLQLLDRDNVAIAGPKPKEEVRADAFAIHLLAPDGAVREAWAEMDEQRTSAARRLRALMERFGVGFEAMRNYALLSLELVPRGYANRVAGVDTSTPDQFEHSEEHPSGDETFEPIPVERRGRLVELVLEAHEQGLITSSRAMELLDVDGNAFEQRDAWRERLRSTH